MEIEIASESSNCGFCGHEIAAGAAYYPWWFSQNGKVGTTRLHVPCEWVLVTFDEWYVEMGFDPDSSHRALEGIDLRILIEETEKLTQDETDFVLDRWREANYDAEDWYHLGVALRRRGIGWDLTEKAFVEAIKHTPSAEHWAGLIEARVEHRAFSSADDAFEQARTLLGVDAELHKRVAWAWLSAGDPKRAAEIIRELPSDDADEQLTLLRNVIEEAAEVKEHDMLPVYSPFIPYADRWKEPLALDTELDGHALKKWYPAAIVEVAQDRVFVVTADPKDRTYNIIKISPTMWKDACGWALSEDPEFEYLELGVYADGTLRVAPLQGDPENDLRPKLLFPLDPARVDFESLLHWVGDDTPDPVLEVELPLWEERYGEN